MEWFVLILHWFLNLPLYIYFLIRCEENAGSEKEIENLAYFLFIVPDTRKYYCMCIPMGCNQRILLEFGIDCVMVSFIYLFFYQSKSVIAVIFSMSFLVLVVYNENQIRDFTLTSSSFLYFSAVRVALTLIFL